LTTGAREKEDQRMIKRSLLLTASALLALAPAALADGRGHGHGHGPPVGVVASGLDNPRGIDVDPSTGAIYVAEAGRGGAGPCIPNPEEPDGAEACFGLSGAITRLARGNQQRIVSGLPSIAAGGEGASGPQDVDVSGYGFGSFVIGLGASPAQRGELVKAAAGLGDELGAAAAGLGSVFAFSDRGRIEKRADLTAYEAEADPDSGVEGTDGLDSNPTSLLKRRRGYVVVDAGGNDLLRVRRNGDISTIAVFESGTAAAPPGIPDVPEGTQIPVQAVPTAVAKGPDGAYYVSQLTGYPFLAGAAKIYRVERGSAPTVYASGLTNVTDLAFGRDGSLYVVEIAANGLFAGPPGQVVKIAPDGTQTTIASEGLVDPYGVAIGRRGEIYVTNHSTSAGLGEVMRVR
jgi:DNA-binding beta-propeller fold protein YncE